MQTACRIKLWNGTPLPTKRSKLAEVAQSTVEHFWGHTMQTMKLPLRLVRLRHLSRDEHAKIVRAKPQMRRTRRTKTDIDGPQQDGESTSNAYQMHIKIIEASPRATISSCTSFHVLNYTVSFCDGAQRHAGLRMLIHRSQKQKLQAVQHATTRSTSRKTCHGSYLFRTESIRQSAVSSGHIVFSATPGCHCFECLSLKSHGLWVII